MGTCSVLELTSCLWLWVGLGTRGNFRCEQTRVFACQACSFFENKFSSQTLSKHLSSLRSLFAPGQFQEQVITASSFQGTYFPDWFPYFVHSSLFFLILPPHWKNGGKTAVLYALRPARPSSYDLLVDLIVVSLLKDLRGVKWVDLYLLSCLHCGFKAITQAPQVPACWWYSLPECLSSGLWACSASSHNCIVSWDR